MRLPVFSLKTFVRSQIVHVLELLPLSGALGAESKINPLARAPHFCRAFEIHFLEFRFCVCAILTGRTTPWQPARPRLGTSS